MTSPNSRQPGWLRPVLAVAAVLFLAGLGLGFLPTSQAGVSCGSAFLESRDVNVAELEGTMGMPVPGDVRAQCDAARAGTRVPALVLAALGLAGIVGAAAGAGARH